MEIIKKSSQSFGVRMKYVRSHVAIQHARQYYYKPVPLVLVVVISATVDCGVVLVTTRVDVTG